MADSHRRILRFFVPSLFVAARIEASNCTPGQFDGADVGVTCSFLCVPGTSRLDLEVWRTNLPNQRK